VILHSLPVASGGTYRLQVDSLAGAGRFELHATLNAAFEDEAHGGASNDTLPTAQDMEGSFIDLGLGTAQRGAVLGRGDGDGSFPSSLTQENVVSSPNVLTFDFTGAPTPLGDGVLTVSAVADLDLSAEFLTLDAEGLLIQDLFVTGGLQQSLVSTTVNLSQAQLEAMLADDGVITFTVTPSSGVNSLGDNFLTLDLSYPTVSSSSTTDIYSFTLGAGQLASLALTNDVSFAVLELLDAGGNLLATGLSAANVKQVINNFVSVSGGTYYANVAAGDGDYSLVVTRGSDFDTEENSGLDTAQSLDGSGVVLGHLSSRNVLDGGVPILLSTNLTDGEGFLWDIQTDGRILNGTSDAYDSGLDMTGFPTFGSGQAEEGGREIVIGPATASGVEVVRKIYVSPDEGFARFLEIVTNTSAMPLMHTVDLRTNLGSGSATTIVGTSSGDTVFGTDDNWIVTDDSSDGGGDPTMLHVIAGAGAQHPSLVSISGDIVLYEYDLLLAPGETQVVMHFASQNASRALALAKAPQLADLQLNALRGMTEAERNAVVNFDVPFHDWYSLQVQAGDNLVLETATPADGPGEFVNDWDPILELYDPTGALVASDDNSAPDGRNALLNHTASSAGTYTVRVSSANQASGAYVLRFAVEELFAASSDSDIVAEYAAPIASDSGGTATAHAGDVGSSDQDSDPVFAALSGNAVPVIGPSNVTLLIDSNGSPTSAATFANSALSTQERLADPMATDRQLTNDGALKATQDNVSSGAFRRAPAQTQTGTTHAGLDLLYAFTDQGTGLNLVRVLTQKKHQSLWDAANELRKTQTTPLNDEDARDLAFADEELLRGIRTERINSRTDSVHARLIA
jgi:hypothetical protein